MAQDKTVTIFCGSSLSIREAREIFPAAHLPGPIKRGDLEKSTSDIICIIDGFFFQTLSVSARELMIALKDGKKIWGASSMGALRAAECRNSGCIGVGAIYEGYATGKIDSDDDVAVAISSEDFKQLSDATVDIEFFLSGEMESGRIEEGQRAEIVKLVRGVYFSQRRLDRAVCAAVEKGVLDAVVADLLVVNFERKPKLKWLDAMACLRSVKRSLESWESMENSG